MTPEREQLLDQQYAIEPIERRPDFWGRGMRHCILVGMNSDIAKELRVRLERDGWTVSGTTRNCGGDHPPHKRWDLCVIAQGTMKPIGKFFDCPSFEWATSVGSNALFPLFILRTLWEHRKHGAQIVFLSGPNPNVDTPTYTAYRAGKAILHSLVGTLNAENPDAKFHWFVPGVVRTKIHLQTLEAGERAANLERAKDIMEGREVTHSHDDVYARLMAQIGVAVE